MKHQITLVGGQILPVYLGITEKMPDVVHILYSKDSKNQFSLLKKCLGNKEIYSYQIDPFDFDQIKTKTEEIVLGNSNNSFELNLTGGTKIMAIACQQVFNDLKFPIFYIDQKHQLFDILDKRSSQINGRINISTFLKLSGHDKYEISEFRDFTNEDIRLSEFILKQVNEPWFKDACYQLYKTGKFKIVSNYTFVHKDVKVNWNGSCFKFQKGTLLESFITNKGFEISFKGLWWEILIGRTVSKWDRAFEFKMSLKIKSKIDGAFDKNEIDIVLNTGRNLVFVECKSGEVTQHDVNKIKAVRDLYGGISARSILVSRKQPPANIIEKCWELGIDVFSQETTEKIKNSNKILHGFTNLTDLPKRLDSLLAKYNL